MIKRFIISLFPISIWFNRFILLGKPQQTVSARSWIEGWGGIEVFINKVMWLVEDNHCKRCYFRYLKDRYSL